MNHLIGCLSCIFLFVPFEAYAFAHLRHHSARNVQSDPDSCNYCWDRTKEDRARLTKSDLLRLKLWLLEPLLFKRLHSTARSLFSSQAGLMHPMSGGSNRVFCVSVLLNTGLLYSFFYLIAFLVIGGLVQSLWIASALLSTYFFASSSLSLFLGRCRTFCEHNTIAVCKTNSHGDMTKHIEIVTSLRGVNRPSDFMSNILFIDSNFNMHSYHHRYPGAPSFYHPSFSQCRVSGQTTSRLTVMNEVWSILKLDLES